MPFECRICGNADDNRPYSAREMMFGTRDSFDYWECGVCGTLQIVEIPDLSKHYPDEYYSFGSAGEVPVGKNWLRRLAARFSGTYLRTGQSLIGKLIVKLEPRLERHYPASLRKPMLGLTASSRILDVGCGTGQLLQALHHFGFRDLTGTDTFISEDITYPTGVRILKRPLEQLDERFDMVMMHHSFEHMPKPLDALIEIHRLLTDDGWVLIRMPVVNFAWETYGVDWVQLDAPRHLYLFTERAFRTLAEQAGFSIEKVMFDSTAFQFWGSEQYLRDIPLNDSRSHFNSDGGSLFSREKLEEWEAKSARLNRQGLGDSACFYLRKRRQ